MEPLTIAFWRFLLGTPAFWLMTLLTRRAADSTAPPLPWKRLMLMGTLLTGAALCAFYGLQRMNAGTYVVIFYTYPAITALIALTLGERLSLWGWVAILLTLVGVALTAPDFSEGLRGDNAVGVLLALLNALIVATYFTFNSRLLRGRLTSISQTARASALALSGALLLMIGITATGSSLALPQGDQWLWLILLSAMSTVLPVFTVNIGIQKVGPTRAAVFGTFEPLLTAVIAWVILSQAMLPIQWVGGIVIVFSMILLQTRGQARKAAGSAPA
jgi:drug/metabolite transporter (DMT)-like permease